MKISKQNKKIQGLLFFTTFIKDLNDELKGMIMKFANYKNGVGYLYALEVKTTQSDHKVLEEWIEKKIIKFNKDKCKILLPRGQKSDVQRIRSGITWLSNNTCKKTCLWLNP